MTGLNEKYHGTIYVILLLKTYSEWNHNYASEKFHWETFCINSTIKYSRSWGSKKDDGMFQTEGVWRIHWVQPWMRMAYLWCKGQYRQVWRPEKECKDEMTACFSVNFMIIRLYCSYVECSDLYKIHTKIIRSSDIC
jgi:hypothetical protein